MAGMTPIDFDGAVPIDGYGPGFFRVGGKVIHGGVLATPDGAGPWAGLNDVAALLNLSGKIDVLFLGMGAEIARPSAKLVAELEAVGIAMEAMSSPSAARSFNVTLSEGRRVACALLPL